jgi:hypothetical protein
MATKNTVKITRRLEACSCGCEGSDPWHRRDYDRELVNVQVEDGKRAVHAYGYEPVAYRATAMARLPWGEGQLVPVVELVLEAGGKRVSLGWFSARL